MGMDKSICERNKHWQASELKKQVQPFKVKEKKQQPMNIKKKISIAQEKNHDPT